MSGFSSKKSSDYHFMLPVKLLAKCKGNMCPGQGKSQGTFLQIFGENPGEEYCFGRNREEEYNFWWKPCRGI